MKWFHNLSISKKLLLSFGLIILLSGVLGIFSITRLIKVNNASTEIATNWMPSINILGKIQVSMARFRISEGSHLAASEPGDMGNNEKAMNTRLDILHKQLSTYEGMISTADEKRVYADFQKTLDAYLAANKKLISLSRDEKKDEARLFFKGESNKLFREINEQLEALGKINEDGATESDKDADQTYSISRNLIVLMLVLLTAVAIVMAVTVARIISGRLNEAVEIAGQVAKGDLTRRIVTDSEDETGKLMDSLRTMNDSLLQMVSQVRSSTDAINTAASEIATGNLDLSNRTEQQAGSLEETASAMEELTSTVKQNADNAQKAYQMAQNASSIATEGGQAVSAVTDMMSAISNSSKKIADIIGVIDGITFQTNILALNAAVEAARAGEQGRGFAVVASEVRTLAQRSAAAAKEIKQLIEESVHQVNSGTALVDKAGSTIHELVGSVRKVSGVIEEISVASREQSHGIDEINHAVIQMDQNTQQNAALVEEAAAAARSMQDQADQLTRLVSVFRLR